MNNQVNYIINIQAGDGVAAVNKVTTSVKNAETSVKSLNTALKRISDQAWAFNQINDSLQRFSAALDKTIEPGRALNASMKDLEAITGLAGEKLKEIEKYAKSTATTFGGSAAKSVESYKLILSKLGPDIAQNPIALKAMGDSVATLSKTMGGDAVAATMVLTTAMNQYQVSLDDPMQASKTMAEMMNVMAAAAQVGSAELPQIQAALEQSGMAAKMAGVSFAETNAAIQVLDKAGKAGSEGGIALRNVMAILSKGRFLPPDVQEELSAAGVDISILTDKSLTLTDRLKPLKSVMSDTALISKLFGMENSNAAVALISGIDTIDEYTKAVQGTNAAQDQAKIIMGSFDERMSRLQARIDSIKISVFNFTKGIIPAFKATLSVVQAATGIMMFFNTVSAFSESAFYLALKKRIKAMKESVVATWGAITSNGTYIGVTIGAALATRMLTVAVKGLSAAIYAIPLVGWILLAITLLIAAFKLLWEKSEGFRRILFGIWEVLKALFYNIGVVIKSLWENIIKPYVMAWVNLFKAVANAIWSAIVWVWNAIKTAIEKLVGWFTKAFNAISSAARWLWGVIIKPFQWLFEKLGGFGKWIKEKIYDPIVGVFKGAWEAIKGFFAKIWEKITSLFAPIKELWNKLFPKDKFKDIGDAWEEGKEKGSESWNKSQEEKNKESGDGFLDGITNGPTGDSVNDFLNQSGVGGSTEAVASGGTRNTAITINLKNMIENMNFNGTVKENIRDIEKQVSEIILRTLYTAQSAG